jgi:hypothetical protein
MMTEPAVITDSTIPSSFDQSDSIAFIPREERRLLRQTRGRPPKMTRARAKAWFSRTFGPLARHLAPAIRLRIASNDGDKTFFLARGTAPDGWLCEYGAWRFLVTKPFVPPEDESLRDEVGDDDPLSLYF